MVNNCCDPTNKDAPLMGHPFSNRLPIEGGEGFKYADFKNPIPLEVIDPEELQRSFGELRIVPFLPSCGENILYFLKAMKNLSPTHGSCIENIRSYVIPSKLNIVRQVNSDFIFDEETDVDIGLKKDFSSFVERINTKGKTYKDIIEACYNDYKDTGNYFIEVIVRKVGNVFVPYIHRIPNTSAKYTYTKPNEQTKLIISPRWDYDYISRNPPRESVVYPNISRSGESFRTVIHIKNGGHWYGLPDWLSSFMHVYREFQDADYLIKQAANEFSGRVFIEVEEDDPDSGLIAGDDEDAKSQGFSTVAERLQSNFSFGAEKPQTVMLVSRGHGAKQAFVFQFKPHTNSEFYKTSAEINELKIIRSHQWSKRFLGENMTQGFSTNVFIDELRVKESGVLSNIRDKVTEGLNIALKLICEQIAPEYIGLSIRPITPFENKYIIQAVQENLVSKNPAVRDIDKQNPDE